MQNKKGMYDHLVCKLAKELRASYTPEFFQAGTSVRVKKERMLFAPATPLMWKQNLDIQLYSIGEVHY